MRGCRNNRKAFLVIAAIGVTAVLFIVVMGVAALTGQTQASLTVYQERSAAAAAVDMYLPGVLADFRAKGATSLTLEFGSADVKCSFVVNPAAADDAGLARAGVRAAAGDVIVTAEAAPAKGAAMRYSILAAPGARGARPYIILEAQRIEGAAGNK